MKAVLNWITPLSLKIQQQTLIAAATIIEKIEKRLITIPGKQVFFVFTRTLGQ